MAGSAAAGSAAAALAVEADSEEPQWVGAVVADLAAVVLADMVEAAAVAKHWHWLKPHPTLRC